MRSNPSRFSTYLNAAVIGIGILLGILAKHDQAVSPPAAAPAKSTAPSFDRGDEGSTELAAASSPRPRRIEIFIQS